MVACDSSTNRRLRHPAQAQSMAQTAVATAITSLPDDILSAPISIVPYRLVLGLGTGRSGSKSLAEVFASQVDCMHSEHEMIVPRVFRRDSSGRVDSNALQIKKGSWGSDRRLEWDAPRLARGEALLTDQEEAIWRVLRLLEQRESFNKWVADAGSTGVFDASKKPKKLGARGWRKYNTNTNTNTNTNSSACVYYESEAKPVVAAVSSVALAYVHEYIALDPSVRIVALIRPRDEVVASFLKKSKGRNHWQKHQRQRNDTSRISDEMAVQRDKTWDFAFPNMSDDECGPYMATVSDSDKAGECSRPDKTCAIRAYWALYNDVLYELSGRYPENVRVFEMDAALNIASVQADLLNWCGFHPLLDTAVHLNKKKKS